eukprot:GHVS01020849.1.p1 GENE.GHVS01020849.1~~GHVS01020849.1.p1  ORF type:complete len:229 (+),score=49.92 GHVS01020849.1:137-823(+)
MTESWEDFLDDSDTDKPTVGEPDKAAPATATDTQSPRKKEAVVGYVELDDPIEEKLRRQRIVEQADAELMEDLFSGCPRPESISTTEAVAADKSTAKPTATKTNITADPLDMIDLKSLKDVESFGTRLCEKIANSNAKSPALLRLLDLLLKECVPKMEPKDVTTLQNKTRLVCKQKLEQKRASAASKKKPNATGTQIREYKDEMELFYGENDEEKSEEEGDAFYAEFI